LWLCSNPPYFASEDEIPVANYTGEQTQRTKYREYLARRYGKRQMLYSGIHFNFSFKGEVENEKYFKLFKYLNMYSYILVLLTGASPVFDGSLIGKNGNCFDGYASRRNGKKGYWNKFLPILDYSDVLSYVNSVNRYIDKGKLYSCAELYMPVRIKTKNGSDDFSALVSEGINHIELRMFDVNPLSPLGIMKEDLEFAHYLILYLFDKEDFNYSPMKQRNAIKRHKKAAQYKPPKSIEKQAVKMLNDMKLYFEDYPRVCKNIDYQLDKLQNENRYCIRILKEYDNLSKNRIVFL
jgi:glutamate--cysteine ligase